MPKFFQKTQNKQIKALKRNFRLILDLWMHLITTISKNWFPQN